MHPPSASGWAFQGTYAPWINRVGAYLIDFIPWFVATMVFYIGYIPFAIQAAQSPASGSLPTNGAGFMVGGALLMLAALGWQIYNRWLTAGKTGQSLGKRVTHIALISEETQHPIGTLNAFLRDLVHVLDGIVYIGYLWPLWDEKKQTFSDKLMKTVVVESAPHT